MDKLRCVRSPGMGLKTFFAVGGYIGAGNAERESRYGKRELTPSTVCFRTVQERASSPPARPPAGHLRRPKAPRPRPKSPRLPAAESPILAQNWRFSLETGVFRPPSRETAEIRSPGPPTKIAPKGLDHRIHQAFNRAMETGACDSLFVGYYLLRPRSFRVNK
jgi:hypothetical protein